MTPAKLPKGITVSLSDVEHGYSVSAEAQVSWPPIGETGGPLRVAFWQDSLVILTPSNSGTYSNLRFYLRGVGYNIRTEYTRQADGTWKLGKVDATRYDRSYYHENASDAARRDLTAILEHVAAEIVRARPDLLLDAAVCETRKKAKAAEAKVEELRKQLREAEEEMRAAILDAGEAEAVRNEHFVQEVTA